MLPHVYWMLAAAAFIWPSAFAPIPPYSLLTFVNCWVEAKERAWLFRGLPGHLQRPCPYPNPLEAPSEDTSILVNFLGTPGGWRISSGWTATGGQILASPGKIFDEYCTTYNIAFVKVE